MKRWTSFSMGMLTCVLAGSSVFAQPGIPAAPAVPAVGAPLPGAVAPAAATPNIWSKLCLNAEQRERLRKCFCESGIGQMATNGMKPLGMATGGMIGGCKMCTTPTAADLAKPADSADGAAARIKQDEAEAAKRRESIRYLGTVDCRYWPEAEDALINGLRADRNECVRLEAACVLQRGCCCTPKIAEALSITIAGSERDGFPAERSERVRNAAAVAISMCSFEARPIVVDPVEIEKQKEKEKEKDRVGRPMSPKEYYAKVSTTPPQEAVKRAHQTLQQVQAVEQKEAVRTGVVKTQRPSAASDGILGVMVDSFSAPQPQVTYTRPGEYTPVTETPKRGLLYRMFPERQPTTTYTEPATRVEPQTTTSSYSTPSTYPATSSTGTYSTTSSTNTYPSTSNSTTSSSYPTTSSTTSTYSTARSGSPVSTSQPTNSFSTAYPR